MAKRSKAQRFIWCHKEATQVCHCMDDGKDGTANHGEPIARVTNDFKVGAKMLVSVTCENHLKHYLDCGFWLVSLNQVVR